MIDRELFVFYQRNNKLYQVQLDDEETNILTETIITLHDGRIKIMEEEFCDIDKRN